MPTHSGLSMPLLPPADPDSDNAQFYQDHAGLGSEYFAFSSNDGGGHVVTVSPPSGTDDSGDAPSLFRVVMPFAAEATFLAKGLPHEALGDQVPEGDAVLIHLGPAYADLDRLLPAGVPAPATLLLDGIDRDKFAIDVESWVHDPTVVPAAAKDEAWRKLHGQKIADTQPPPTPEEVDANYVTAVMDGILYVALHAEVGVGSLLDSAHSGRATLTIRAFDTASREQQAAWLLAAFGNIEPALALHPIAQGAATAAAATPMEFHLSIQYYDATATVQAFAPLVGATVSIIDFLDSDTVLVIGVTDAGGVPAFDLGTSSLNGKSFFFRIHPPPSLSLVLQDLEMKSPRIMKGGDLLPWDTTFQFTDDGHPGWYDPFVGYRLGDPSQPLVFYYGVPVQIDLMLTVPLMEPDGGVPDVVSGPFAPQTMPFPRGVKVLAMCKSNVVDTFWTDQDGRVRAVSFKIMPAAELDIAVESVLVDPSVGIRDEFVACASFNDKDTTKNAVVGYRTASSTLASLGVAKHVWLPALQATNVIGAVELDWRLGEDLSFAQQVAAIHALSHLRRAQEAFFVLLEGEPTRDKLLPTRCYVHIAEITTDQRSNTVRVQARDADGLPLRHPTAGVPIYCALIHVYDDRWWDQLTAAHEYGHSIYNQLVGYTNENNPDLPTGSNSAHYFTQCADYPSPHWSNLAYSRIGASSEGYAEAVAMLFGNVFSWPELENADQSLPYRQRVNVNVRGEAQRVAAKHLLCSQDGRTCEGCVAEAMFAYVGDLRDDLGLKTFLPQLLVNKGAMVSQTTNPRLVDAYPKLADPVVRDGFRAIYWLALLAISNQNLRSWTGLTTDNITFVSPYDYLIGAKMRIDKLHFTTNTANPTYADWKSKVLVPWQLEYTNNASRVDTDAEIVNC